ncbi:MAG: hypothetical protein IT363_11685 [Methanoregulaceae archaeon]|nr:hypothetical protein [Methanoregulaceae archaeon]
MKSRLTFLLLGMATAGFAADTITFTGIRLVTYLGNDNGMTVYETGEAAGNGWLKQIVNSWAEVVLACDLNKRYNEPGNHRRRQYGDATGYLTITTTKTPDSTFRVSFLRERAATAIATVEMTAANAYAYGIVGSGRDGWETKPAAQQNGPGSDDRTKVAAQDKVFATWSNVQWGQSGDQYHTSLAMKFERVLGDSVLGVPSGSGSNQTAASARSGGRIRYKGSTLAFGAPAGRNRWISGTYNGSATNAWISCEVRSMNNVFLDGAQSYSPDSSSFDFDLGQMSIPASPGPSTYKVTFRRKGALNKMLVLTVDPQTGLNGVYVDFKYGDVNQDNQVTAAEVGLILEQIGTQYPNSTYFDLIPGQDDLRISDLDVDGDGSITMTDYLISLPNIGLVGD